MANLWIFLFQISVAVFVHCAERKPASDRRYGVSLRMNPYNELLEEKAVQQELMRRILAKLGMTKRPPFIPYDQRKQNIPQPIIDGGITIEKKEDIEKRTQIVIAAEEESRANCQDKDGCYAFKLNHLALQRYIVHQATIHIHNEAQTSTDADSKIITINEIKKNRKRRSAVHQLQETYADSHKNVPTDPTTKDDVKAGFVDVIKNVFKSDLFSHWQPAGTKESKKVEEKEKWSTFDKTDKGETTISAASGSFQAENITERPREEDSVKDQSVHHKIYEGDSRSRKRRQSMEDYNAKKASNDGWHIKRKAYVPYSGWFTINADDIINRWIKEQRNGIVIHKLEFSSHGLNVSTKAQFRPFILLDITEDKFQRSRKKRSYATTCKPGYDKCCLRKFYVNFKDINWHDWIVQPRGYEVNYCEGRCTGTGTMSAYSHAFVKKQLLSRSKKTKLQICCIPLKFDSLALLYFDVEGTIRKQVLQGMSVLECGCV